METSINSKPLILDTSDLLLHMNTFEIKHKAINHRVDIYYKHSVHSLWADNFWSKRKNSMHEAHNYTNKIYLCQLWEIDLGKSEQKEKAGR